MIRIKLQTATLMLTSYTTKGWRVLPQLAMNATSMIILYSTFLGRDCR
jgi:hypothetical protein